MIAILLAVFVASLLGSLHCAGMCGAFAACAAAPTEPCARRPLAAPVAYNVGRLTTYVLLGAAAGGVGAAIDFGGAWVGVQRAALLVAGALMVTIGLGSALRLCGARLPLASGRLVTLHIVRHGFERAAAMPPTRRAAIIGLLTTLLPCGWLYAFAITAAGTGSPIRGAATMAAFWLGTLPLMAAIGAGVQSLAGPLARRGPWLAALLLISVGLYTLTGRLTAPMPRVERAANAATVAHVRTLDAAAAPCCHAAAPEARP